MSHCVSSATMPSGTRGEHAQALTICNLILLPSSSIVLILLPISLHARWCCPRGKTRGKKGESARRATHKSMPMVVMNEGVHESSQNRSKRQDLPTPRKVSTSVLVSHHRPQGPLRVVNEADASTYRNLR